MYNYCMNISWMVADYCMNCMGEARDQNNIQWFWEEDGIKKG